MSSLIILSIFLLSTNDSALRLHTKQIRAVTVLTHLPAMALSTPYLEKRILYYDDFSNRLFPQMQEYSSMDFVYAK